MARFLRNIGIAFGILLVLAWGADRCMTRVFRNGRATKVQWVNNMHHQHYDLIIIGSSRAWWNIDMNTINRSCGLRTLNLAGNHYRSQEVLLLLKTFFSNGNTTDRILLQVDHNNLNPPPDEPSSAKYELVPYLHDSLVQAHLHGRSAEWVLLSSIPLWRYVKSNALWGPEEFVATVVGYRKPLFDSTGTFLTTPHFTGADGFHVQREEHHLDPDMLAIIALCRARNIPLECFTSPYLNITGTPEALGSPRRVVEAAGLVMHDFSQRLVGKENFNDRKHLSIQGGARFTTMLVNEVVCPPHTAGAPAL